MNAQPTCDLCGEPMPPGEEMFKVHGATGPCPKPPLDPLTHKPDGTPRHPSVAGVLRHFRFAHLPAHLQAISKPCGELAIALANKLPENADLTCALRDLLAAKDNFVRASLP